MLTTHWCSTFVTLEGVAHHEEVVLNYSHLRHLGAKCMLADAIVDFAIQ